MGNKNVKPVKKYNRDNKIGSAEKPLIKSIDNNCAIKYDDQLHWDTIKHEQLKLFIKSSLKNSSDIINKITIFCLASKLVFTIEIREHIFFAKVTTTVSDIICILFGISDKYLIKCDDNVYVINLNYNIFSQMDVYVENNIFISLRLEHFRFINILTPIRLGRDDNYFFNHNSANILFPFLVRVKANSYISLTDSFVSTLYRKNFVTINYSIYYVTDKEYHNLHAQFNLEIFIADEDISTIIMNILENETNNSYRKKILNFGTKFSADQQQLITNTHNSTMLNVQYDLHYRQRIYNLRISCPQSNLPNIIMGIVDLFVIFCPNVHKSYFHKINDRKTIILAENSLRSSHASFIIPKYDKEHFQLDYLFDINDSLKYYKIKQSSVYGYPLYKFRDKTIILQINKNNATFKIIELFNNGYFSLDNTLKLLCFKHLRMFCHQLSPQEEIHFKLKYEKNLFRAYT